MLLPVVWPWDVLAWKHMLLVMCRAPAELLDDLRADLPNGVYRAVAVAGQRVAGILQFPDRPLSNGSMSYLSCEDVGAFLPNMVFFLFTQRLLQLLDFGPDLPARKQ